ncbi:MAG: monofunctional biosynthetic peptidoglycan transglycosylase [Hyphomicrobium sp.]
MDQRDDSAESTPGAACESGPPPAAFAPTFPPLPMPPRLYGFEMPPIVDAGDVDDDEALSPPLPLAPRDYGWTSPTPSAPFVQVNPQVEPAAAVTAPPVELVAQPQLKFTATTQAAAPEAPAVATETAPRVHAPRSWFDLARRAVRIAALAFAGWIVAILALLVVYRIVDPPLSSLMLQQRLTGQEITQHWVALDDISLDVIRAVMLSEDGRFCQHSGVDFEEMQNAIDRAGDGGVPRGASTISMQVIKNLFLWPSKSYVRKAIEIPLTYAMEALWPKQRIMEVYLNVAEWGPGVFGVEAASQHHFSKSARRLNQLEAARLAVALPNPFLRDAGDPGPRTRRLATDIQARMRAAPASQTSCVVSGRSRRQNIKSEDANPESDGAWDAIIRPEP